MPGRRQGGCVLQGRGLSDKGGGWHQGEYITIENLSLS